MRIIFSNHKTMQDSMIYLSNPASDGANEMPRRDMNAGSTAADGMPVTTGEMPIGSMTDGPANLGGASPPATGEMPTGAMTGAPGNAMNQTPIGTGEMPTGSMNQSADNSAGTNAPANNAFELSGTWKLQLTTNQITVK